MPITLHFLNPESVIINHYVTLDDYVTLVPLCILSKAYISAKIRDFVDIVCD